MRCPASPTRALDQGTGEHHGTRLPGGQGGVFVPGVSGASRPFLGGFPEPIGGAIAALAGDRCERTKQASCARIQSDTRLGLGGCRTSANAPLGAYPRRESW